jgi:hypothetical protein
MATKGDQIIEGMKVWFEKRGTAKTVKVRTEFQRGWDSGVMAALEFVRRMQDYDETLALEIMKLMTPIEDEGSK